MVVEERARTISVGTRRSVSISCGIDCRGEDGGVERRLRRGHLSLSISLGGSQRQLDQYLATLNPHRVGFPYTPLPLPFHNEPVFGLNDPLFNKQVDDHRSQTMRILDNNTDFSWRAVIIVRYTWCW